MMDCFATARNDKDDMNKIQDANIENKRVLLRLDLNVPIKDNQIIGDRRIREVIPTIQFLLDKNASQIIIITHLGKPKGEKVDKYSLWPIANCLAELLSLDVNFSNPQDEYKLSDKISMLENLRFNSGEEENDSEFAKQLASHADIFVNDAFGTCHRAHASTSKVAEMLPSFAGLLIQKEIENLNKLLTIKEKPFTVILGGAKIADKLPVIKNLMSRADNFLIGGAVANTFLAARRHHMGKSLVEPVAYKDANLIYQNIMDEADRNIYLPKDILMSLSQEKAEEVEEVDIEKLLQSDYNDFYAVDIGPDTIEEYQRVIKDSKTIFGNGNMGISEVPEFSNGTDDIAEAVAKSDAQVVIGGGDTVAAVEALKISSDKIFLSTGGGATLEFLAGKQLPGLKALGYSATM